MKKPTRIGLFLYILQQGLCFFGRHKWEYLSTIDVKHERKSSGVMEVQYGTSKFYNHECECCEKKQWYVERYSVLNGFSKSKINI